VVRKGKVGKKGGRGSGVIEQGVADRKRENKRQVFVNEGGRDVQADDDAAKAAGIAAETPGRFASQPTSHLSARACVHHFTSSRVSRLEAALHERNIETNIVLSLRPPCIPLQTTASPG
jgi:hypothetical protein